MPPIGNISPHARRCLENLAVAGPSTAAELNELDPKAPDHRQTIRVLEQSRYVVSGERPHQSTLAAYSLTDKARRLLAGHALERADAAPRAVKPPDRRSYANPLRANTTPPMTHGSMTTGRLHQSNADMLVPATRAGAERALQIPSRVNDTLHYRDGRTVQMNTNPGA
jgi:hypothetical protein